MYDDAAAAEEPAINYQESTLLLNFSSMQGIMDLNWLIDEGVGMMGDNEMVTFKLFSFIHVEWFIRLACVQQLFSR